LNQVISLFALLEYQLKKFKTNPGYSAELVSVSSLALAALEYKLQILRQSDAYDVAAVLDPILNKRLPGICKETSWDYDTVFLKIFYKL
jgi:hypothetical protein